MIRTVIIDDDKASLKMLGIRLKKFEDVDIIGTFWDPIEALEFVKREKTDAVFLDIEMPRIRGMDLAEEILRIDDDISIIFVTGYEEFAVEAFEIGAVDYLLKPLTNKRLEKTVRRVSKRFIYTGREKKESRIKVYTFQKFRFVVDLQDIKWRTSKTRELIAYLVHNRCELVHKDRIMEDLWSDKNMKQASTLLHTSVYNARKALKEAGIVDAIEYTQDMYKLNIEDFEFDFLEFEKLDIMNTVSNEKDVKFIETRLEMYKAPYLYENDFSWTSSAQEGFLQIYKKAVNLLSEYFIEAGDHKKALVYLLKLYDIDQFDEEVHKKVIKSCKSMRDSEKLNLFYEEIKEVYINELGIDIPTEIKEEYRIAIKSLV